MKLSKERTGEYYILFSSFLWGLFPVITVLTLNKLSSLLSLGISTVFAACFFAIVISLKKKWSEFKNVTVLKDILLGTFFIGILYFGFYFLGLRYTSPGNASIIALTEVFFSFIFFHVWRKDQIPFTHIVGAVFMVVGAIIVLYPSLHKFQIGDLLVMIGAFFAPFGNFFQQKARKKTSSEVILFIRSLVSSIVIFFLAFALRINLSYFDLKSTFFLLLINGFFLLGFSKILWIEGIHRIYVTKAVALESMSPLITLLFAWLLLKNIPTVWQLFSFIPMFFGIIFLGINKNVKERERT